MQYNKATRFVQYVDNFLDEETLKSLQDNFLQLTYPPRSNEDGTFGNRHQFDLRKMKKDPLLARIKEFFFPYYELEPYEVAAHMRHNNTKPMVHTDHKIDTTLNFLLFVKGEPLLNNGTGFFTEDGNLSSHVGFVENRAIFFNGAKILHTDLQSFGESSPRYTLNIFYKKSEPKAAGF